jgi:hypothetical protein
MTGGPHPCSLPDKLCEHCVRELMAKSGPGSRVHGVQLGEKITGGRGTGVTAVVVLVDRKLPPDRLRPEEMIPRRVGGMPTDVQEKPIPQALWLWRRPPRRHADLSLAAAIEAGSMAMASIRAPVAAAGSDQAAVARHRPVVGGVSIIRAGVPSAGTLGVPLLIDSHGRRAGLTNWHVAVMFGEEGGFDCAPWWTNRLIVQPATLDGGNYWRDQIGWAEAPDGILFDGRLNYHDAALVRYFDDIEVRPVILRIGHYTSVGAVRAGDTVHKYGRTTGHTTGTVLATDAVRQVAYGIRPDGTPILATFVTNVASRFLEPGDSGSAVLKGDRLVGLGFAGSAVESLFTDIRYTLERYGLSLPLRPEEAFESLVPASPVVWQYTEGKRWRCWTPGFGDMEHVGRGTYMIRTKRPAVLRYGRMEVEIPPDTWRTIGWCP